MKFYFKLNLFLIFIIFFNLQTFSQISEKLIGEQIWTTSNLNITKFQNGDIIYEAKTNEQWSRANKDKKPAWCYYQNNSQNGITYGKLYNWYAVNDSRGLAPKGWHIPSKSEWLELFSYLRKDNKNLCEVLKSTTGWKQYEYGGNEVGSDCRYCNGTGKRFSKLNYKYVFCEYCNGSGGDRRYVENRKLSGNGTNKSGFAAKPVSKRFLYGDFDKNIGDIAIWWTSTESNANEEVYSVLFSKEQKEPNTDTYNKGNGFSVRLVKDKSKEILEKERIAQEEQNKKDSSLIIGKSVVIGNLVVAQYDFPNPMNWYDAKSACASLGKGWRLPTKDELITLNINRKLIEGLKSDVGYWSSTEVDLNFSWIRVNNSVGNSSEKIQDNYVRAVRTF
jgi:uncharacterized protein (TIGR02145 family)